MRPLERLVDIWIGRNRAVDPTAADEMVTRTPAVVVTGGSEGIGAAIAAEFARRGSHAIVLVARREAALAECAARLAHTFSIRVETIALDLTAPESTTRLVEAVQARGLYIDILVVNAGMGLSGPFVEQKYADIAALLDLNIRSLTQLIHKTLPDMVRRGRGGILTLASLGGYVPGPHQALYYASKAYVLSLTEAISHEVSGLGVRVTVSAPGPITTWFHNTMGATSSLYLAVLPLGTSEHVARRSVRSFMLGRKVIVPGLTETCLAWILRIAPHSLTVPLVAALLKRRDGPLNKK